MSRLFFVFFLAFSLSAFASSPNESLQYAIRTGQVKLVVDAIRAGADPNHVFVQEHKEGFYVSGWYHYPALSYAMSFGYYSGGMTEVIEALLENGANAEAWSHWMSRDDKPNGTLRRETTPLQLLAHQWVGTVEQVRVWKALVARGAKLTTPWERVRSVSDQELKDLNPPLIVVRNSFNYDFKTIPAHRLAWLETALREKLFDPNFQGTGPYSQTLLVYTATKEAGAPVAKLLLDYGADPNGRAGWIKTTALITASAAHNDAQVTLLLSKGADPNLCLEAKGTNLQGSCPLTDAYPHFHTNFEAAAAFRRVQEALLKAGAKVEGGTGAVFAVTPAARAVGSGRKESLELLVKYGFNLAPVKQKLLACALGFLDHPCGRAAAVVAYLREQGADIDASVPLTTPSWQPPSFVFPMVWAVKHAKCADEVKWLLSQGAKPKGVDEKGNSPLHTSVQSCPKEATQALIGAGAKPDVLNHKNETPLTLAVAAKAEDLVSLLFSAGANPGFPRYEHLAVEAKSEGVLVLLLKWGAKLPGTDGESLLNKSVAYNWPDATEALLGRGVDVNAISDYGITPLGESIRNGRVVLFDRLLKHPKIVLNQPYSKYVSWYPIHDAATSSNPHFLDRLLAAKVDLRVRGGTRLQTPLHLVLQGKSMAAAKKLIEAGAEVDAVDSDSLTPLHLSTWDAGLIELLITKGANIGARSRWGYTPVHQAIAIGEPLATLKAFFAKNDAAAKVTDLNGITPLMHVVQRKLPIPFLDLFVHHGAEIDAKDKNGKTAVDFAKANDYIKAIVYLCKKGSAHELCGD